MITTISPHLDDAAFSVGGTLSLLASYGVAVRIVNCFTRSRFTRHGLGDVEEVSTLRAVEDACFIEALGPEASAESLRRSDALGRPGYAEEADYFPDRPLDDAECAEASALAAQLAPCLRGSTALLVPLAIGAHVDHRIAQQAALVAAPDDVAIGFYEDLPYACSARETDLRAAGAAAARAAKRELWPVVVRWAADKGALVRFYGSQVDDELVRLIARHADRYRRGERLWVDESMSTWLSSQLAADVVADAPHESSEDTRRAYRRWAQTDIDELEELLERVDDAEKRCMLRGRWQQAQRSSEDDYVAGVLDDE